jgi:hypothetical protein
VNSAVDSSSLTATCSSNFTPDGFGGSASGAAVGLGAGVDAGGSSGEELGASGTTDDDADGGGSSTLGDEDGDDGTDPAVPQEATIIAIASGKNTRRGCICHLQGAMPLRRLISPFVSACGSVD